MEQCKIDWEKRRWTIISAIVNGMAANGKYISQYNVGAITYEADILIDYLKNEGKEIEDDAQV